MKKFLSFFAVMFALLSTALPGWAWDQSSLTGEIRLVGWNTYNNESDDKCWSYDNGIVGTNKPGDSNVVQYVFTARGSSIYFLLAQRDKNSWYSAGSISLNSEATVYKYTNINNITDASRNNMSLTVDEGGSYILEAWDDDPTNGSFKIKVYKTQSPSGSDEATTLGNVTYSHNSSGNSYCLVKNDANWDAIAVWVWKDSNYTGGIWPGANITNNTQGDYKYWVSSQNVADGSKIIVNNNDNGSQSSDSDFHSGAIYKSTTQDALVSSDPTIAIKDAATGKVTISTVLGSAGTIYYTIDGTTPSSSNNAGSGTSSVDVQLSEGTKTIKAVVKFGNCYSEVASVSATYTPPATPKHSISLLGAFNRWNSDANKVDNVEEGTPVTFTVNGYENNVQGGKDDNAGFKVLIDGEKWYSDEATHDGSTRTLSSYDTSNSNMKVQSSDEGKDITFTVSYDGTNVTISYTATGGGGGGETTEGDKHLWNLTNSWPEGQNYRVFYVSGNQNGGRVSPEWELLPQSDGTFLLQDFMVIPGGNFYLRVFTKSEGTITYKDYGYGNGDNYNYWLDRGSSGLPTSISQQRYSTSTKELTLEENGRYIWWQMGHTIVSVRFNVSTKKLNIGYDFTKPSTLKGAPVEGIPFIALMGSDIRALPIEGDHKYLYNVTKQYDGAGTKASNNDGYTNAWLQYDEDGKVYVYDALENQDLYITKNKHKCLNTYLVTNADRGSTGLQGVSMYNTIQPPRNLVYFYNPTTTKTFTSDKITFKYRDHGTYDIDAQTIKANTNFALYDIRDLDMSGYYKAFTGHGSYLYGYTFNGLSLHTNWGIGDADDAYATVTVSSGEYRTLSGAGPHEKAGSDSNQVTNRNPQDTWNNYSGGTNADKEDNKAGSYFQWENAAGKNSTYVSILQFYYALESDSPGGGTTDNARAKSSTYKEHYAETKYINNTYTGNTGRNFSWLYIDYAGNSTMIELAKKGPNAAEITYAINPNNVAEASTIKRYEVKLYYNESSSTFPEDADGIIQAADVRTITVDPVTGNVNAIASTKDRVGSLSNGYYKAQIVAVCQGKTAGEEVTYISTSDVIRVVGIKGRPTLKADQVITYDAETEISEYTFNVKMQANIKDVHEQNHEILGEAWDPEHNLLATYIFPYKHYDASYGATRKVWLDRGTGTLTQLSMGSEEEALADQTKFGPYKETDPNTAMFAADPETGIAMDDKGNLLYAYQFRGIEASTGTYDYPAIIIEDYVPGKDYEFAVLITGSSVSGGAVARDNAKIEMPKAVFTGDAELKRHGDDYNYVEIPNGHFELVNAKLADATDAVYRTDFTLKAWNRLSNIWNNISATDLRNGSPTTTFSLDVLHEDDSAKDNNVMALTQLPYFPDTENGENMSRDQSYFFRAQVTYVRKDEEYGTADVANSTVSVTAGDVNTPRKNILDPMSNSESWASVVNGKNTATSETEVQDQITIIEKVKEGFYGAISVYNDALVAAKINPASNLAYTFDITKQKISHFNHPDHGTNFHKDTHLAKDHANSPFVAKEVNTLRRWDTKPTSDAHFKAPDGFQYALKGLTDEQIANNIEKYYADKGNRGEHEYKRVATNPSQVEPFWAGHGTEAPDDLMNGFYTAEDHYKGTSNEAMPAWDGGEMLTLNTFQQMAYTSLDDGNRNPVQHEDINTGLTPHLSNIESWFKDYYNNDYTLIGEAPTPEAYAEMCVDNGYVLLRVGHVNHQAFYHPAGWAGLSELVGTEAAEDGSWKFAPTDYVPLTYSLEYEYPFLNNYNFYSATFAKASSSPVKRRTAPKKADNSEPGPTDITNVVARSTGFLPFDGSILDSDPIPTGVDNVNADSAANANGWLTVSYDSNSATVSVRSNDAVGRVDIISLSGAVVASRTADVTYVELNVSHLAPGAYIVSVNGSGAKKIII